MWPKWPGHRNELRWQVAHLEKERRDRGKRDKSQHLDEQTVRVMSLLLTNHSSSLDLEQDRRAHQWLESLCCQADLHFESSLLKSFWCLQSKGTRTRQTRLSIKVVWWYPSWLINLIKELKDEFLSEESRSRMKGWSSRRGQEIQSLSLLSTTCSALLN